MVLVLAPILAQALTVDIGDRSEVRARVSSGLGVLESDTQPFARLRLTSRQADLSVAYSPSITVTPNLATEDPQVLLVHTLSASAPIRFRFTTIQLSQSANYGQLNLSAVPVTSPSALATAAAGGQADTNTPQQPQTQPAVRDTRTSSGIVHYGSLNSAASIGHAINRRTGLGVSAGYQLNGGIDDESQQVFPLQKGPSASVWVSTFTAPDTRLTTTVSGQASENTTGTSAAGTQLTEGVQHNFSKVSQLNVDAGLALWRIDPVSEPVYHSLIPIGTAQFQVTTPIRQGRVLFRASAYSGPVVDQYNGLIDVRAQVSGQGVWTRRSLGLGASVTGTTSVQSDVQQFRSVGTELRVIHTISRAVQISEGVRGAWQEFQDIDVFPLTAGVFVALSVQSAVVNP